MQINIRRCVRQLLFEKLKQYRESMLIALTCFRWIAYS